MIAAGAPPVPAFLASFVDMSFRFPEGSVVVHGALPHRRIDEIYKGLGMPPGPEAQRGRDPSFPPVVMLAAGRWPERAEPDESVIVEAAIAVVERALAENLVPVTPALGHRLAGLLETLREHPDFQNSPEDQPV